MGRRVWKKALVSAALAAAVLTVPAGAHSLALDGFTILPNEETQKFWEEFKYPLNDQGITEHSADNWNFCAEFNDGLLLIQDTVSPTEDYATWHNYVDKNGQLHNLNQGRYREMYSFSEGLAAVVKHSDSPQVTGNVGYVDTSGNEVIPCDGEWDEFLYGGISLFFTGRFENGRAVVLRSPELPKYGYYNGVDYDHPTDTTTYDTANPDRWYGIEYAYIDTKGNYLTDWTLTQDINTVLAMPLYDQDGIRLYDRVYGLGSSSGLPGEELPPEPDKDENAPFVPEYHAPALPDYNQEAESLFASTAKITKFKLAEADIGTAILEITNPTDMTDAGVIAVALANTSYAHYNGNTSGVFFVPYELAAGQTGSYSIEIREIINKSMFNSDMYADAYADQVAKYVAATVFTFEDDADLNAFYATIPFEQHWYPSDIVNEFQPLCDAAAGKQWLQEFAGISRYDADLTYRYYYYPDGSQILVNDADHSLCEK